MAETNRVKLPTAAETRRDFKVVFHQSLEIGDEAVVSIVAIALAHVLWRNTEAIEDRMHAGRGKWSEAEMIRNNAWITRQFASVVRECSADRTIDHPWSAKKLADSLTGVLLGELSDGRSIPAVLGNSWTALVEEIEGPISFLKDATRRRGVEIALGMLSLAAALYGQFWWGSVGWRARVEWLLRLPEETPETETLRQRLLDAPWELSDAQADWFIGHRYDMSE